MILFCDICVTWSALCHIQTLTLAILWKFFVTVEMGGGVIDSHAILGNHSLKENLLIDIILTLVVFVGQYL